MEEDIPASRWKKGVDIAKDVSEYAKLLALIFAVIGFISVYFPWAKRRFEMLTMPYAWYYVGELRNGAFGHYDYQNPSWDGSPLNEPQLAKLEGTIMVTTKSNEPHNGRTSVGQDGTLMTVAPDNTCLLIVKVQTVPLSPATSGPRKGVWMQAQRLTC